MAEEETRLERGTRIVGDVYRGVGSEFLGSLAETCPDLPRFVREFAFGDIYSRPGLSPRDREIAIIASLTTLGYAGEEVKAHMQGALNVGVTREELIEVVLQTVPYAGFPAAIGAMRKLAEIGDEEKRDPQT